MNLVQRFGLVCSISLLIPALHAVAQGHAAYALAPAIVGSSSSLTSANAQDQQNGSTITSTVPPTAEKKGKGGYIPTSELWKHPGLGLAVGINGIGLEIAEPIAQHFNVRAGGGYFRFEDTFTSDGAQVDASMKLGGGHASLDYFPWSHHGFHISPQLYFGVQTSADVTVIVPSGQQISLSGGDYVSSATDPLHGSAEVSVRKVAPGLTIGYGNLAPRRLGSHWSFPVELGFYYLGQPDLKINFSGSACDPSQPPAIGCQKVNLDVDFQKDLQRFTARQNNNLSYASFFPVLSFGVGYRF
ncbi:hypothetical protein [Terriglobus sp. RCC_193]|uniref:hypothetical protein n=1 Tax=Terriglobus sp. RCC_193 TaxID=3239218 RepID=UPI003523754E